MRKALTALSVLSALLWPLIIAFALYLDALFYVLPWLALIMLIRAGLSAGSKSSPLKGLVLIGALMAVALCTLSFIFKAEGLVLWYPVAVNALFLMAFAGSLVTGMPLVERLARLSEPCLDERAVSYTRRVTEVWCGFFVINGAVALFTVLKGDMALWTLWNGALSYVCMGTLMGGEYLVRRHVRRENDRLKGK